MRTLGVDLASASDKTACCLVHWQDDLARVEVLKVGQSDDQILELAARADYVGIDAPFGWPAPFIEALNAHRSGDWPLEAWTPEAARSLRFRRTDVFVHDIVGRWPLSVSSDLIGVPAMRCAGILKRLGVEDRSGAGKVIEVYPAASLAQWGLRASGYKGKEKLDRLRTTAASLEQKTPWLDWSEPWHHRAQHHDDAFDALVASMSARAQAIGLCLEPSDSERALAKEEGWIAVPKAGSLARLVGRVSPPA